MDPPLSGLTMYICAEAGFTSMGCRAFWLASLSRALARACGRPQISAPVASARYSRPREMAIWMSMAAMGARIIIRMVVIMLPPPSSSRLPPKNRAKLAR